jgi:hypothetical protein
MPHAPCSSRKLSRTTILDNSRPCALDEERALTNGSALDPAWLVQARAWASAKGAGSHQSVWPREIASLIPQLGCSKMLGERIEEICATSAANIRGRVSTGWIFLTLRCSAGFGHFDACTSPRTGYIYVRLLYQIVLLRPSRYVVTQGPSRRRQTRMEDCTLWRRPRHCSHSSGTPFSRSRPVVAC